MKFGILDIFFLFPRFMLLLIVVLLVGIIVKMSKKNN